MPDAWSWPERVDYPGESRVSGGWVDPNEYYLEVWEPRHYPNGPALPLDGPIPDDHPVVVAKTAARHAIRIHRDRFVEGRRFLHDRIEAGHVEAVRHWWYGEYCEMNHSDMLSLIVALAINLEVLPGTPDAETVSAAVRGFVAKLASDEHARIRVTLGMVNSELNPYDPRVLYGESGEESLREFTGERYVPPIRYRLEGMRLPDQDPRA
jgi:hypothetical protein